MECNITANFVLCLITDQKKIGNHINNNEIELFSDEHTDTDDDSEESRSSRHSIIDDDVDYDAEVERSRGATLAIRDNDIDRLDDDDDDDFPLPASLEVVASQSPRRVAARATAVAVTQEDVRHQAPLVEEPEEYIEVDMEEDEVEQYEEVVL